MASRNTAGIILENPLTYVFFGTILAIAASRLYVLSGAPVTIIIDGVSFHHFFIGVALMAVTGILSFLLQENSLTESFARRFLALLFGAGLGLVIDETGIFLVGGQGFTLSTYYLSADIIAEAIMVLILFTAWICSIWISVKARSKDR